MNATAEEDALAIFLARIPTKLDILLPPLALMVVILTAVFGLSIVSHRKWCCRSRHNARRHNSSAQSFSSRIWNNQDTYPSGDQENSTPPPEFLSPSDLRVIGRFLRYPNSPMPLFRICLPSLFSLVFCPVTLFTAPMMVEGFWPPHLFPERPNVNDAIACFLMPAGLVYAIAFGFSMQDAMEKNKSLLHEFREEMACLHQMVRLTTLVKRMAPATKLSILTALKGVALQVMEDLTSHEKQTYNRKYIWSIVDALQNDAVQTVDGGSLDGHFMDEMTSKVLSLDSMMADGGFTVQRKIDIMQWMFLELLGFISFFGVLLIRASSYLLELTICMLTVFSISLFCYILADFDDPFHGFFRLNVSGLADLVTIIHNYHREYENELDTQKPSPAKTLLQLPKNELYP